MVHINIIRDQSHHLIHGNKKISICPKLLFNFKDENKSIHNIHTVTIVSVSHGIEFVS